MKRLIFVLLVVGVGLLIPFLQFSSQTSFQAVGTMDALRQIKLQARASAAALDPASLRRELPWEVFITARLHEKGTVLPERAVQLDLTQVSPRLCRALVLDLASQMAEGLWQQLEVNGHPVTGQPDAAARKALCAGTGTLAVYFRI